MAELPEMMPRRAAVNGHCEHSIPREELDAVQFQRIGEITGTAFAENSIPQPFKVETSFEV